MPAIIALVLGIIGILLAFVTAGVLGILLGIPAIILGVVGRRKVSRGATRQHGGIAMGGLVTGIISLVLGIILLVVTILAVGALFSDPNFQEQLEQQQEQLQQP